MKATTKGEHDESRLQDRSNRTGVRLGGSVSGWRTAWARCSCGRFRVLCGWRLSLSLLASVSGVGAPSGASAAMSFRGSSSVIHPSVLGRELVAILAMGFQAAGRPPPLDILSNSHGFQVSGVHATRIPAKVVESQPFRDGANHGFIGPPMGDNTLPVDPEKAISPLVYVSSPTPASRRSTFINLGPEPFCDGIPESLGASHDLDSLPIRKDRSNG